MPKIVLIAHNLRSAHNVGSLLRTADGLGIDKIYLTGYTPYPALTHDPRLPHLAAKINRQISKTALGAEKATNILRSDQIEPIINDLRSLGYQIAALEQTSHAQDIASYKAPAKLALIVGREVEGIEPEVLKLTDIHLQIPMQGDKESFNVAVAAAIALYSLKNHT